ncbi:MAG TPA: DUF1036 domain-containing protein [Rhodopseudomonas sp.]|uniref:DUF1036 domain-containing protein n=1 Tax=Rhodopseudomonas sp. TaxID=1078 RepID=UPI002ED8FBB6
MWLRFANHHGSRVWVAVGYYSPNCPDGGDWAKKGWWKIEPGQAATVLWTTNKYSTFYAEADDGSHWSGSYHTPVPLQAFDWCWNTSSTQADDVGMRLITVTNAGWPWTGTINLT